MMRVLICLFLFSSTLCLGQRENIVSFRDNLVITAVLNTKDEAFDFINDRGQTLEYSTAPITGLGMGVDYKWFTFEYTKRLNSFSNEGLYGHTENFGIGFGFTMPKWYFRNFLEMYDGYHLTNPDLLRFNYLDSIGSYPYRSDISTFRYLATFNWIFNSDTYSSLASFWQLERQESSAGSWVAGVTYSLNGLHGDSAFIPAVQSMNFDKVADITAVGDQTITANIGYQHTFVLSNSKKWFIHLGWTPGLGAHWGTSYSNVTEEFRRYGPQFALSSEGRFIVGFNGDKWYYGFTAISYGTLEGSGTNPISSFNNYNRVYLGYRFSLPEKVSKNLEKIGL